MEDKDFNCIGILMKISVDAFRVDRLQFLKQTVGKKKKKKKQNQKWIKFPVLIHSHL